MASKLGTISKWVIQNGKIPSEKPLILFNLKLQLWKLNIFMAISYSHDTDFSVQTRWDIE